MSSSFTVLALNKLSSSSSSYSWSEEVGMEGMVG